jgi:hypothetical protein
MRPPTRRLKSLPYFVLNTCPAHSAIEVLIRDGVKYGLKMTDFGDHMVRARQGSKGSQNRKPGRPPVHDEAWTKVTVVLFNRQIVFLDRLAASIRARNGSAISRAQLIRALLDAVADADVDLTSSTSEADLKAALLARLGRYRLSEG